MKRKQASKAEQQRMAAISQMPCIVCLLHYNLETPAEVHHLMDTGRRRGHMFTIPLCHEHHRKGVKTPHYVSRHPFKNEFVQRYGDEDYLLKATNMIIDNY